MPFGLDNCMTGYGEYTRKPKNLISKNMFFYQKNDYSVNFVSRSNF